MYLGNVAIKDIAPDLQNISVNKGRCCWYRRYIRKYSPLLRRWANSIYPFSSFIAVIVNLSIKVDCCIVKGY